MSETNEQRIARLTELARKVWPGTDIASGRRGKIVTVEGDSSVESAFAMHVEHPRALDAIEAALLVLAGEPGNLTEFDRGCFESMRHNLQRSREHGGRERERAEKAECELAELRAKLSVLAEKWDGLRDHKHLGGGYDSCLPCSEADGAAECADELRAALGGEP